VAKGGIREFTSTEEAVAALQKQRYRAMTEEQLLQDVRRFLTLQGWKHWHVRYSRGERSRLANSRARVSPAMPPAPIP
jgi:hypothetical protein